MTDGTLRQGGTHGPALLRLCHAFGRLWWLRLTEDPCCSFQSFGWLGTTGMLHTFDDFRPVYSDATER